MLRTPFSGITGRVALTAVLVAAGFATPKASSADAVAFNYRSFDCAGFIRREGTLLELGERVAGDWHFRDFSCVGRSCVHHREETSPDGTALNVFHQIYFPGDGPRFVSTRTVWRRGSDAPLSHKSLAQNPNGCFTIVPNDERWTLDMGEIRYDGDEVHAQPRSGDYRVDYYYAPKSFLGDWSGAKKIVFEKKSSGGLRYLPAYFEDIYGDVVLRNGSMRASYEIPQHHTGEWRTYEVPLDGPGWVLKGGATSLSDVLKDVTRFQIRAQYGPGKSSSAIRNVRTE